MELPGNEDLTNLLRQQIVLYPERYGVMGQYSREMLEAMTAEDFASFGTDMLLVRLTTTVMCGHTISEKPSVVLKLPKNPWQHVKYKADQWQDRTWCALKREVGWKNFWMWMPFALAVVTGKWTGKRPVKYTEVTADITFDQRVLYPEVDAPAVAGRPVIYETISVNYPDVQPPYGSNLSSDPSRFYNRHEIINDFLRDPVSAYPTTLNFLYWLERRGVNVDQFVKRS